MKIKILAVLALVIILGGVAAYALRPIRVVDEESSNQARDVARAVKALHHDMGKVQPGDWLQSHHESGQTFRQYLKCNPVMLDEKRNKLYVQPIGEFDEDRSRIVKLASEFMAIYFGCEVKIRKTLSTEGFPARAKRVHPRWGMRQLLTTYILYDVLKPELPDDAFAMIAFTSDDLWPEDGWNFVFGQASLRGRVGVWSIYRNGDPATDFPLCLERTLKTATHETGHMFSIEHCIAWRCNMNGSNNRAESDRHPVYLCPECLPKVLVATKVEPQTRFEKLAEFCQRHKLKEGAEYYARAAKAVKSSDDP